MPKVHELKCWPGPFADVLRGVKRFEWRRDDRGFKVGDTLRLREWGAAGAQETDGVFRPLGYTGSEVLVKVIHIVRGKDAPFEWGIPRDYCIMSIEPSWKTDPDAQWFQPGGRAGRKGRLWVVEGWAPVDFKGLVIVQVYATRRQALMRARKERAARPDFRYRVKRWDRAPVGEGVR